MITKLKHSWELFKASLAVTFQHRKLLWFPVLSTILTGFIALFFISAMALPVVFQNTGYRLNQKQHWDALESHYVPAPPVHSKTPDSGDRAVTALTTLLTGHHKDASGFPWGSAVLLALYLVSMFLATFFNVAFYSEIIAALNGKGVSFRRGLATARSRLPSILAWSLLAGIVGWLIRAIEQRLPFVARILVGLLGMAWSVAAVFAIPVIIQQKPTRNPVKILQQSALTLKRTWGEGLIGYVGFSAASTMIVVASFFPLLLALGFALLIKSIWFAVIAGAVWVLGLFLLGYISSVARDVFCCALYLYASEGVVPGPYNADLLDMAWRVKRSS